LKNVTFERLNRLFSEHLGEQGWDKVE